MHRTRRRRRRGGRAREVPAVYPFGDYGRGSGRPWPPGRGLTEDPAAWRRIARGWLLGVAFVVLVVLVGSLLTGR